jgi:glycosyltransferase involved in cell wall biosynthesis
MPPPVTLTVAIPTMNRWAGFLKKQFPVYVNHEDITTVIVCDETGADIEGICEDGYDEDPKVRLFQNPQTLGIYANKRQCLLNSQSDFTAVLDSDNFFEPEFFTAALACIRRDGSLAKRTIYCAGDNIRQFPTGVTEERVKHFNGMRITRENWNRILETPGWNFLLNDGNYVWPTGVVRHFPELADSSVLATDGILTAKMAVEAGYTISIEPSMRYVHMVHPDSTWIKTDRESSRILASNSWKI